MSSNPFGYSNWLSHDGDGGKRTTDEVLLGQNNRIHSPDDGDPGSVTLAGATIIDVRTPDNAALVGNNGCVTDTAIGVYGHSDTPAVEKGPRGPGIGVLGSCDECCGVMGLARTGPAPLPPERVGVFGTGDNTGVYGLCLAEPLPASFSMPNVPGVGVFGQGDNAGVQGLGGNNGGKGMFGQGGGGTAQGVSPGVVGNAGTNAPNDGVQGFGSGNFSGVAGFGDPNGNGTGVFGTGRGPQSAGVRGIGAAGPIRILSVQLAFMGRLGSGNANGVEGRGSGTFAGVAGFGDVSSTASGGIGVFAVGGAAPAGSSQLGGPGVYAVGHGGPPYTPLALAAGVYGIGGAGNAPGIVGQGGSALGDGVHGSTVSGTGVSGESGNGVGVRATSSSSIGLVAVGTTGLFASSSAAGGTAGEFTGNVSVVNGNVTITGGNVTATGGVQSVAVVFPDGSHRRLYSVESPESWFEDFGFAKLVNGQAHVELDTGLVPS